MVFLFIQSIRFNFKSEQSLNQLHIECTMCLWWVCTSSVIAGLHVCRLFAAHTQHFTLMLIFGQREPIGQGNLFISLVKWLNSSFRYNHYVETFQNFQMLVCHIHKLLLTKKRSSSQFYHISKPLNAIRFDNFTQAKLMRINSLNGFRHCFVRRSLAYNIFLNM